MPYFKYNYIYKLILTAKLIDLRNGHIIVLLFTAFTLPIAVFCQQSLDTSFRQKSINNLADFYHTSIGIQAHLYNGPLYELYARAFTEGHQYYVSASYNNGSVSYDGMEYLNVPMKYDIIRDELVILHPNGFPLNLSKEKVDSFSFPDHRFIKLKNIKIPGYIDSVGYYNILYSSPAISFFIKRRKYIQESSGRSSIETKVYAKNFYYIFKKGIYHQVKNKKSVLELLKDKKQETQHYIKSNKLRFKSFEQDVLQIVTHYDQLM